MDEVIVSNKKRIAIKDDEGNVTGEICFNPSDVHFAEKFYAVSQEFQSKQAEYEQRAKEIDAENSKTDENGVPVQFLKGVAFAREVCEFVYSKIDELFGVGTSEVVFRGVMDIYLISQFFEGITPFIQNARSEKITRYTHKDTGKVLR